ncbi:MAG: transglutaminase-like domain-containing protein [Nanoarchaeota archaeon]|nr:transglutaminase-like domain-containing protein [Nanoarchaeota archaeon]MBU1004295.1 transglutaminase-like domain-containing protein [Nanoarchaeota archaeon]MBU1945487.1 transglutaminase-like domain-containing protein [Nanoarchaeota archaeon]
MDEDDDIIEKEPWHKGPIKYIIGIFLLLLIVLWYFPTESIKLDPEPFLIPSIDDVMPSDFKLDNETIEIKQNKDFYSYIKPYDPTIKQIANKIATIACDGNQVCQSKAIYYFVRDNIEYVADPLGFEYVESPKEALYMKSSDCDGGTILLASLLGAIGVDYELVFIPSHVFLSIRLKSALKRYKIGEFVYLDWTCKDCKFGELPLDDKRYIKQ